MRSTLVISFLKHASIYNRPSSVQFFVQRQPSKELQRSLLRIARHKRRAELTEIMASTAPADYSERWETMWSKGLKPGEASIHGCTASHTSCPCSSQTFDFGHVAPRHPTSHIYLFAKTQASPIYLKCRLLMQPPALQLYSIS